MTRLSIKSHDNRLRPRSQPDVCLEATVLFVDMIGFTEFCVQNQSTAVIAMLRDLLSLLTNEVAYHSGKVEKLLGDGLMAVFYGSASNAVECGIAMQQSIAEWNRSNGWRGDDRIQVAVGIHNGPVIMGSVGGDQWQERAVLGDTVNIASRVEGKCRSLDATVLMTAQVIRQIAAEGYGYLAHQLFTNFGFHELRGRSGYAHLYGLERE